MSIIVHARNVFNNWYFINICKVLININCILWFIMNYLFHFKTIIILNMQHEYYTDTSYKINYDFTLTFWFWQSCSDNLRLTHPWWTFYILLFQEFTPNFLIFFLPLIVFIYYMCISTFIFIEDDSTDKTSTL